MLRRLGRVVGLAVAWLLISRCVHLAVNLTMRLTGRDFASYFGVPRGLWSFVLGVSLLAAGVAFVLLASRWNAHGLAAAIVVVASGPITYVLDSPFWGVTVFEMVAPIVAALVALAWIARPDGDRGDLIAVSAVAVWVAVSAWVLESPIIGGLATLAGVTPESEAPRAYLVMYGMNAVILTVGALALAFAAHRIGASSPLVYHAMAFVTLPAAYFMLQMSLILDDSLPIAGLQGADWVAAWNAATVAGAVAMVALPAIALFLAARMTRGRDVDGSCLTSASTRRAGAVG